MSREVSQTSVTESDGDTRILELNLHVDWLCLIRLIAHLAVIGGEKLVEPDLSDDDGEADRSQLKGSSLLLTSDDIQLIGEPFDVLRLRERLALGLAELVLVLKEMLGGVQLAFDGHLLLVGIPAGNRGHSFELDDQLSRHIGVLCISKCLLRSKAAVCDADCLEPFDTGIIILVTQHRGLLWWDKLIQLSGKHLLTSLVLHEAVLQGHIVVCGDRLHHGLIDERELA